MLRKDFLKSEFGKHKGAYIVLMLEMIAFIVLFMAAWPNRFIQRLLIGFMVFFYIIWGSTTHFKTDHLTRAIFFEYLGVALLSGLVLFLITL